MPEEKRDRDGKWSTHCYFLVFTSWASLSLLVSICVKCSRPAKCCKILKLENYHHMCVFAFARLKNKIFAKPGRRHGNKVQQLWAAMKMCVRLCGCASMCVHLSNNRIKIELSTRRQLENFLFLKNIKAELRWPDGRMNPTQVRID